MLCFASTASAAAGVVVVVALHFGAVTNFLRSLNLSDSWNAAKLLIDSLLIQTVLNGLTMQLVTETTCLNGYSTAN